MGSSSEMENEMENVRRRLLGPEGTRLPGLPAFLAEGLGLCPWAHSGERTHTHMHSQLVPRNPHTQWHALVVCFPRHGSRHIREETRAEKCTDPGRRMASHLVITPARYRTDTADTNAL